MGYFIENAFDYASRCLMAGVILLIPFHMIRQQLIQRDILRRGSAAHEVAVFVFAVYMGAILALTLLPPRFTFPPVYTFRSTMLAMWRGEYIGGKWILTMLVGNVVMFIPFGLLMPVFWKQHWWQTLLIALGTILCIELIQPFLDRGFDVDDIFLNLVGATIGLLLSTIPRKFCPRLVERIRG